MWSEYQNYTHDYSSLTFVSRHPAGCPKQPAVEPHPEYTLALLLAEHTEANVDRKRLAKMRPTMLLLFNWEREKPPTTRIFAFPIFVWKTLGPSLEKRARDVRGLSLWAGISPFGWQNRLKLQGVHRSGTRTCSQFLWSGKEEERNDVFLVLCLVSCTYRQSKHLHWREVL